MKPSGMVSSKDEDTDNSASGSSGSGRSGEVGKGRRKGRGPRHRLPHRHRRDVKVCLDHAPEGAVHMGYSEAHKIGMLRHFDDFSPPPRLSA